MRKLSCILTSEAKTKADKKAREMIIDAYLMFFFETEEGQTQVIVLSELVRRIDVECDMDTRRKFQALHTYMLERDIDVVIIDDATEVN